MIPENQDRQLGYKAFILLALRRVGPGILFFLLGLLLSTFSDYIFAQALNMMSMSGTADVQSLATFKTTLMYLIAILYIIGVLGAPIGFLISLIEYHNYTYLIGEFDLVMKKGILHKRQTSLPYRQIQSVNIDRPFVYLLFGLSKLILLTAGTEEKDEHGLVEIVLEPMDKDEAEEIRNMLEREIGVQITEDVVKADSKLTNLPI